MLIQYIKAILLGIVEGITEWLPISSTGHLILLEPLLSLGLSEKMRSLFDVVVQLGAVLAVPVVYRKKLFSLSSQTQKLYIKLIIATIPASIAGLAADVLTEKLFGRGLDELLFRPIVVAAALIIYGIVFIAAEKLPKEDKRAKRRDISYGRAFAIGCFQALALVPGTSRSGATILGARLLGTDKEAAAEFSFFAALPVISAASVLELSDLAKEVSSGALALPKEELKLLACAFITAFALSLVTIRFLTDFIKRHSFAPFGIYRILLGLAVLALLCI
ncbi:MAG: undecaprenyl-diphosphate phosphatase [Ruminococcaceae bacterium]|nr:undecaprenyl-diphosphate phosphatase [Oscillospiraceae bacterium]